MALCCAYGFKVLIMRVSPFSVIMLAVAALLCIAPELVMAKGYAEPWQLNFIEPATPVKEKINEFHHLMLYIISAITVFVTVLLLYAMVRFREKANPKPSKTTHNVLIEVIWTALPVMILVAIAVPSLRLLYFMDATHLDASQDKTAMTLKVVGYQWYWGYEYPDYKIEPYDSNIVADEDIKPGQLRLLEVDNHVVIPVDTNIRVQVTAADVIHSWAMPSFGIKTDAVPGRLNETWMRVTKPGTYYGQCSELCGVKHGFMPIVIEAVSKDKFEKWVISKGGVVQSHAEQKTSAVPAELPAKGTEAAEPASM